MANTTADKLQKVLTTKNSIRQAIVNKGVAVPDDTKFADYATKIEQIETGGIPDYIAPKNNISGTYKAANTATSFSVNGATDIGIHSLAYGFYQCSRLKSVNLSSLTNITSSYAMYNCFFSCSGLTSVDLPLLSSISGSYAMGYCFYNCTNLTSINLSSLRIISGKYAMNYCFNRCKLTSVALPSLIMLNAESAMADCFAGCTNLTSADLSSLETINGENVMYRCFYGCSNLTSINLSSLRFISGEWAMNSCFGRCTSLTDIRFPALNSFGTATSIVTQFRSMLDGVTGCTLHFPSNMQTLVSQRDGYPNFSGTNTVVLFDLPAV